MDANRTQEDGSSPANHARPRVVVLGCGFGGLAAARGLRRAAVDVTVIDRSNHHLFQPLLYQVATAALSPGDIASPIRRILRGQRNARVMLADVTAIEPDARRVTLADGDGLDYDYLIVAVGAVDTYFGHDDWRPFAPGLKSIGDALDIRRRMLLAFELAEREPDEAKRRAWMTFVIVGAGPTGVELAGTFIDVAKYTLAKDFRHIDPATARVILLEGGDHVLPAFDAPLPDAARRQLQELGVEVRTGSKVTGIDADGVSIGDERIEARTVIWAAGVTASPLAKTLGAPLDRTGRVLVGPDLSVPGHPEVFVIGDLAHVDQDGGIVPGVAPAAIQGGEYVSRVIRDALRGERPTDSFHYVNKGMLATIGRAKAVGQIGRLKVTGVVAWLMWLFIHILFLVGFRNRLLVLIQWGWSYLTYDRGARLITGQVRPQIVPEPEAGPARR